MVKAWIAATIAMSIAIAAYYAIVDHVPQQLIFELGLAIPLVGGAVGAYVAPQNKFSIGAATVVPALLVVAGGGYLAGRMGFGDFIGFKGIMLGMGFSLPLIAGAALVGAGLGAWASKRNAVA